MITIIRGDDVTIPVTFKDSTGAAINLTGSTVYFTVKKNPDDLDAAAVISKDIVTHTNPTTGSTTISLTHAETSIAAGRYFWDLQIKDNAGKVTSTVSDALEIRQDITTRS